MLGEAIAGLTRKKMCKIHVSRCPKCLEKKSIPYLCPKIELGLGPSKSYILVWDEDCNRPWCKRRDVENQSWFEKDACENCHEQQKFLPDSPTRECQIELVSHPCEAHLSRKEKERGATPIYKSVFRIQENVFPGIKFYELVSVNYPR